MRTMMTPAKLVQAAFIVAIDPQQNTYHGTVLLGPTFRVSMTAGMVNVLKVK